MCARGMACLSTGGSDFRVFYRGVTLCGDLLDSHNGDSAYRALQACGMTGLCAGSVNLGNTYILVALSNDSFLSNKDLAAS